jgi:hypothetical protein
LFNILSLLFIRPTDSPLLPKVTLIGQLPFQALKLRLRIRQYTLLMAGKLQKSLKIFPFAFPLLPGEHSPVSIMFPLAAPVLLIIKLQ